MRVLDEEIRVSDIYRRKDIMSSEMQFTEKEIYYIEEVKKIGAAKGDCKELSDLCHEAYADYRSKVISAEAYRKIYAICMDYAYPR